MKTCESCGAEATVHIVGVHAGDEGDRMVRRHLCEECAESTLEEYPSEPGSSLPPEDMSPEEIVAKGKQFADTMRKNSRRMASRLYDSLLRLQDRFQTFYTQSPLYKRLRELHVPFGSTIQFPESRQEWIDAYVQRIDKYWGRFLTFVEKHKRWPTDEEWRELFEVE